MCASEQTGVEAQFKMDVGVQVRPPGEPILPDGHLTDRGPAAAIPLRVSFFCLRLMQSASSRRRWFRRIVLR